MKNPYAEIPDHDHPSHVHSMVQDSNDDDSTTSGGGLFNPLLVNHSNHSHTSSLTSFSSYQKGESGSESVNGNGSGSNGTTGGSSPVNSAHDSFDSLQQQSLEDEDEKGQDEEENETEQDGHGDIRESDVKTLDATPDRKETIQQQSRRHTSHTHSSLNPHEKKQVIGSFDLTPRTSNTTTLISSDLISSIPKSPPLVPPKRSSSNTSMSASMSASSNIHNNHKITTPLHHPAARSSTPNYGGNGIPPTPSSSSSKKHSRRTPYSSDRVSRTSPRRTSITPKHSSSSFSNSRSRSRSRSKSASASASKSASSSKRSSISPKTLIHHLSYILTDDESDPEQALYSPTSTTANMISPEAAMVRRTPRNISHPRQLFYYLHLDRRGLKRTLMIITISFIAFSIWRRSQWDRDSDGGNGSSSGGGMLWDGGTGQDTNGNGEEEHYYFPEEVITIGGDGGDNTNCHISNEQALFNLRESSSVQEKEHGAVAADDETCSQMGVSILRDKGGNAVDAAVTTAFCLGVVNPASSGIGGGGFILVHMNDAEQHGSIPRGHPGPKPRFDDARNGKESTAQEGNFMGVTELIDCREVAPLNATSQMYTELSAKASVDGPLSIAIPGEARGLELAHYRYGKLSWGQVMEPVVQLAEEGVPVSRWLADEINNIRKIFESSNYDNKANGSFLKMITKDGVSYLKEGDIMRRPEYAKTLRSIMEYGADYLYRGSVAQNIANEVQRAGGIIQEEDIIKYRPTIRDPLIAKVKGFNIVTTPPPSSGGAVIIGVLRFLSGYLDPFASFASALSKHRMVEAFKHGFAIRMSMSDPAFNTNVTKAAVTDLIEGSYMEELRRNTSDTDVLPLSKYGGGKWAQIKSSDDKVTAKDAKEGDRRKLMNKDHRALRGFNYLEDHGTTHLSVVDKDRNAVAITSSINFHFGSKFVSSSTGILFNDQMDDFATPGRPNAFGLQPSESNYVSAGKRPLSSMAPTMLFYSGSNFESTTNLGRLFLVLGSSGGPKIITSIIQVILNHAILGKPLYEAVTHPRVHDQLLYHMAAGTGYDLSKLKLQPGKPTIEVRKSTLDALTKRGHNMFSLDYLGTTQAVGVDLETDKLTAVSDVRKNGQSAGY